MIGRGTKGSLRVNAVKIQPFVVQAMSFAPSGVELRRQHRVYCLLGAVNRHHSC